MSIYKRISGIRPSPLQNLHLQPSEPPPSATKEQLILFDRVLGRRTDQLYALPLASLSTVYGFLVDAESPTAQEIKDLLKKLPKKEPSTDKQYISFVLFLLIENFHRSIDVREKCDIRKESLAKLQHILDCLDAAYADYNEENKRTEQDRKKRKEHQEKVLEELEVNRKKADQEARNKERELIEAKEKAEIEARAKAELEASRKKAEEEVRARAEQEAKRKAKQEAEAKRKAEQEARLRAEEEAKRKAEQEARAKAEQEARAKAQQEAKRKAEQEARAKVEQEARAKAQQEAKRKAEQEARAKVEQEARAKAQQEAKRKAEQEARAKVEQEVKRKAEQEAKRKAEQEAKRKAEQEAKRKAEQEAKRKAEQEANDKRKQLSNTAVTSQSQNDKSKSHSGKQADHTGTDLADYMAKEENLSSSTMGVSSSRKIGTEAVEGQVETIEILDSDDESVDNESEKGINDNETNADAKLSHVHTSSSTTLTGDMPQDGSAQRSRKLHEDGYEEYLKSALSKKNSVVKFSMETPVPRLPIPEKFRVPSSRRTVIFKPDVKCGSSLFSSSLQEDKQCRNITFHQGHSAVADNCSFIDGPDLDKMHDRYAAWDPYWEVVHDLSLGSIHGYQVGYKTTRIMTSAITATNYPPLSAMELQFSVPPSIAASLKKLPFQKQFKERRLFLRSLPIVIPEKYKKARSDTHIWPKGTFVQLNDIPLAIVQRRQQSHDHSLWKGSSYMLDLTQSITNFEMKQTLTICTKDADSYNFQLVVCEYIPPDVIFDRCIGDSILSLTKLSFEEGRALVQQSLDEKNAVVLDDSDGEDETEIDKSNIFLTVSLLCGASMSAIQVPVRGKKCKHTQCFDLKNYLLSNSHVSGGRWRCLVCEDFVPVRDLMIDGFIGKILEDHGQDVSSSRDKVEIHRNGTWKFLQENKLRYHKKRPCPSDQLDGKRHKSDKGRPPVTEIIDIIDD